MKLPICRAMSSAMPTRPTGKAAAVFASISLRAASGIAARIGVSITPGETALTRTGARSMARLRASDSSAPLAAPTMAEFGRGRILRKPLTMVSEPPALISAALAGACLGFLPHNFNPAKIFMGDSGSMLIGLMLAAASTSQAGDLNYSVADPRDLIALLTPLIVVAAVLFIPLLDLIMAIIRRTRKGLSIGSADKMHLHHRFLEIGHSQRRAVLLIYLWAGLLAFGAVALAEASDASVRGADDVQSILETSPLGAVPPIRNREEIRRRRLVFGSVTAAYLTAAVVVVFTVIAAI